MVGKTSTRLKFVKPVSWDIDSYLNTYGLLESNS